MKNLLICGIFIFFCGVGLFLLNSDKFDSKLTQVVIENKEKVITYDAKSSKSDYKLSLLLEDGRLIDLSVAQNVWTAVNINESITFELSEQQIQYDWSLFLVRFAGFLLMIIGAMVILTGVYGDYDVI